MGEKGLAEAYILGIPFGLFGAHHFYLGRKRCGILYACTLGLLGIGWLYDLVRMRWLVRHVNSPDPTRKSVSDTYLFCALSGLFGKLSYVQNCVLLFVVLSELCPFLFF